jgi:excisionase family DNA binding protein
MRKQQNALITPGKLASEIGVHPATVRRWIQTGRIKTAVRIGRTTRLDREAVLATLNPHAP